MGQRGLGAVGAGLARFVQSPANWAGMGVATVALLGSGLGFLAAGGALGAATLAALGYGTGFAVVGLWMGFPQLRVDPLQALEFNDQGDARTAITTALAGVRQLVDYNPQNRLSGNLQQQVQNLCTQLADLLDQWERSKGQLSLEESFHARHIALRYLPDALKTYLSIPKAFATTQALANGKTSEQTFVQTLDELGAKVRELNLDLAGQDAAAFLNHSKFLHEKFGDKPSVVN